MGHMGKTKKKMTSKGASAAFVVDRLVNNESRIPVQPLYSDTPYWYDLEKLEAFWNNPSKGFPQGFYAAVKGSPEAFANALPASYRDRINEVWVQEFEFSPSAIAFNSYQKNYTGSSFYRRDIITGAFSYKGGRLSGVATSALRGWVMSDGSTSFEHYDAPSGVQVGALQHLVNHGVGDTLWKEAGAQFSSAQSLDSISVSIGQAQYFSAGWENSIFSSNLL